MAGNNNKANEIALARANPRSATDGSKLRVVDGSGLIAHAKADAGEDDVDDLDITAEFPVLVVDDALYACEEHDEDEESEEAEEEETEPAPIERPSSPSAEERASFWLQHLESDVQRLRAKWESVAADLRVREARVQDLCGQVEARDALIGDLRRQIGEQAAAQLALKTDLEHANARIDDLGAARAAREIQVARARSDLQEAREAIAAAEAKHAALAEEKVRLIETIDRHSEATAGAERRYEDEARLTSDLRARIQELETYIDGRKTRWSTLREKIAAHRDALGLSEQRVADTQARFLAETMLSDRLATEAADLGCRLKKLGTRLAERATERRELKRWLKVERAAATQLRADLATATARGEQALGELNARNQRVAQLELLVLSRDETIAGLEQRLRVRERAEDELLATKSDLEGRAAALEQSLSERQEQLRLAVEDNAKKDRDFGDAQEKITRVEGLLREAGHEIDDLVTAVEEHERTISSLEADLRARQDAVGILARSVRCLDNIGTSMEGLDRLLVSTAGEVVDTHVPPESEVEAAAALPDWNGVAKPSRKMVVAIDGKEQTTYPLRNGETTIGRSDASDIQIRRPFISRMHARIVMHGSDAYIEDVGSTNGIVVNSKTVDRRAKLRDGDLINLGGSLSLRYVDLDCRRATVDPPPHRH
jgi:predicted  nucleic acid-binding Zn-ribbon protein